MCLCDTTFCIIHYVLLIDHSYCYDAFMMYDIKTTIQYILIQKAECGSS